MRKRRMQELLDVVNDLSDDMRVLSDRLKEAALAAREQADEMANTGETKVVGDAGENNGTGH